MSLNPRLKYWIRIDPNARPVAGSGVYRLKRPLTGRWIEVEAPPCCAAFELRSTPADVTDTTFLITITCDGDTIATLNVEAATATTDIDSLAVLLRAKAKSLGKWAADGAELILQISPNVAANCPEAADLAFTVAAT